MDTIKIEMVGIGEADRVYGVLIRAPTAEWLDRTLDTISFPFAVEMPCGEMLRYESRDDLPDEDTPCPCGDESHWAVKYEIDAALDTRKQPERSAGDGRT